MARDKRSINESASARLFHFDAFELDIASGELRFGDMRLTLQPQPLKVLSLLVSKSGQIVTREEISRQVWNSGIFVDFDAGLNFCVRQIRRILGEDARCPRFIETVHRRGYRFIARVSAIREDGRTDASPNPKNGVQPVILAVLPFQNLGCLRNQDPLADGITELLITYLATNSLLRVVSRTTSMQYKGAAKPLARIGQELGADRVLEGAVLQSGMRVRIAARLVNTLTDQSEWAACYDADVDDRLLLQEHVACAVASDAVFHLASKLKLKNVWMPRNILAGEGTLKSPGRVWPMSSGNFASGERTTSRQYCVADSHDDDTSPVPHRGGTVLT
jgi:TolB-like protein